MRAFRSPLVAVVAAGVAVLAAAAPRANGDVTPRERIAVVEFEPGALRYRPAGDFQRGGRAIDAPAQVARIDEPFAVMATQVSQRDYARCAAERACPALKGKLAADLPVVGVSWLDATAYAAWLSRKTGEDWGLPTDVEWAYAAGARFHDDAVAQGGGASDAQRWLAKFDQESARAEQPKAPQPFGHFGANARGLLDLSGNVWEWTDTCYERVALDAAGAPSGAATRNCHVRVLEGDHRMFMSDFIRDGLTGGCSVGAPPANLGMRLVRHPPSALRRARRAFDEFVASL
jgi:formylglycine-generating enzyme required for sulfatase activity